MAKKPVTKTSKKPTTKQAAPKKTVKKAGRKPVTRAALVSVAPGFTVNDVAATLTWYTNVLGFKVEERWEQNGALMGAEIVSGPVRLMFSQDDFKLGRKRVKGAGVRLYITSGPKIDAFATTIKANGGILDHDPMDGWGVRALSITDPDGYKLTFMTPLKKTKKTKKK
jgi:uncharacterized glyoxalase superfamily protein PhnB